MAETKRTMVARLFAEHRGALQAFLYRRVRRGPDAAELAQEVYVRLLRVPDIGAILDPGAYQKPFKIGYTARYALKDDLMEYICAENNQDVTHITTPAP